MFSNVTLLLHLFRPQTQSQGQGDRSIAEEMSSAILKICEVFLIIKCLYYCCGREKRSYYFVDMAESCAWGQQVTDNLTAVTLVCWQ